MIAVGIDVSKTKSTIAIVDSFGEILMKPTDFMHTESSLSHLVSILNGYSDDIKVVMEATGHYHQPILKFLLERNFFVSVINPYV